MPAIGSKQSHVAMFPHIAFSDILRLLLAILLYYGFRREYVLHCVVRQSRCVHLVVAYGRLIVHGSFLCPRGSFCVGLRYLCAEWPSFNCITSSILLCCWDNVQFLLCPFLLVKKCVDFCASHVSWRYDLSDRSHRLIHRMYVCWLCEYSCILGATSIKPV